MSGGERQIEMTWRCSTCSACNRGRDMTCICCGDPKDASERYEMPADTRNAPTVTDPALRRAAKAGPNWRCSHCGSDQRRTDGACVQCGGVPARARARRRSPEGDERTSPTERREGESRTSSVRSVSSPGRETSIRRGPIAAIVAGVVAVGAGIGWATRTRTYDATVSAVRWERRIVVDRYHVQQREGWRRDLGSEAFDVESLGQHVHHYDAVLDHYETESYTVSVPCGQDCRPIPQTCSESCSSNDNGFATCRTTCSGGGESCETRYCNEWRTRDVPRYRDEPRYAERVRYRIWDWGYDRTPRTSGTSTDDVHWPEGGARPEAEPNGERERERREADYRVTLVYADDDRIVVAVPEASFASFPVDSSHVLETHFRSITLDGAPVERVQEDP